MGRYNHNEIVGERTSYEDIHKRMCSLNPWTRWGPNRQGMIVMA